MSTPPVAECGRCGQDAYVGRDGIRCYCTRLLSAQEHHETEPIRHPVNEQEHE